MKNIRIRVDSPALPAGSSLSHTATSWQVAKYPDFSNVDNIITESLEDSVNLLEYREALNLENDETVYLRTRYHFGEKYSNWSRVTPINTNQKGIKISGAMVSTPVLNAKLSYDTDINGEVIITGSDFNMYSGAGNHASTTWEVIDSNNVIIFKRDYDVDNLTEIKISNNLFEPHKAYEIKATYHSTTNANSNQGKTIYNAANAYNRLFKVIPVNPLIINTRQFYTLQLYTTVYKYIDIIIKDKLGNIVSSNYEQYTITPYVEGTNLVLNEYYSVYARVTLTNDLTTDYVLVYTGIAGQNVVSRYNPNITYTNKSTYVQDLITGGDTVQSIYELPTYSILFSKQNSNKVYLAEFDGNTLNVGNPAIVLEDNEIIGIPYINILPLSNNTIVINYSTELEGNNFRSSIFKLYNHNITSNTFTLLKTLTVNDQLLSTAVSGSAVVDLHNNVYFIPAREVDVQNNLIPLSLYKLDTQSFTISKVANLPFTANSFVSLATTIEDNLVIFGGANISGNNPDNYYRSNNDVYVYSKEENTFTKVMELPQEYYTDIYNIQSYMRSDGRIIGFNSVTDGTSVGNQNTLLIDLFNMTATINPNDNADNLVYRSTILLLSGDLLRISSQPLDPQKVFNYVSNTMSELNMQDDTNIITPIEELVVPAGTVVTIENITNFSNIVIEGTNMENTGTLRWVTNSHVAEFKYNDMIILNDINMTYDELAAGNWRSINEFNGAILTITT